MNVRQRTRSVRLAWAPSRARQIVRHRIFLVGLFAAFVAITALTLHRNAEAVARAERTWGEVVPVLVVVEPVAPGDVIADAVHERMLPRAMIPSGAVSEITSDERAHSALFVGEVLIDQRVRGSASRQDGSASAAVTVTVVARPESLAAGAVIDLWYVESADLTSERVMRSVTVIGLSDDHVTVEVPEAQLADAIAASLRPLILTVAN